jgi:hypothetical protein
LRHERSQLLTVRLVPEIATEKDSGTALEHI